MMPTASAPARPTPDRRHRPSSLPGTAPLRRTTARLTRVAGLACAWFLCAALQAQVPTTITLTVSNNHPVYVTPANGGEGTALNPVRLTATVTETASGNPVTGGTVTFYDNPNVPGNGGPDAIGTSGIQIAGAYVPGPSFPVVPGTATLTFAFGPSTHTVTAVYSGTSGNAGGLATPNWLPSTTGSPSTISVSGAPAVALTFQVLGPQGTIGLWDPLAATTVSHYNTNQNPVYVNGGVIAFGTQLPAGTGTITDTTTGIPYSLTPNQNYDTIYGGGPGLVDFQVQLTDVYEPSGTNYGNYIYSLGTTGVTSFLVADLTQAGVPALITLSSAQNLVYLYQLYGGATGLTPAGGTFNVAPAPAQAIAADVNGDGLLDLVIAHNDAASGIGILRNTLLPGYGGNQVVFGGDIPAGIPLEATYPVGHPLSALAVGDLNGDGRPDIVALTSDDTNLAIVLLNNGDGTFTPGGSFPVGNGATQIALADFNQDGLLDAAVLNAADSTVGILQGVGDGTFASMAPTPVDATPTAMSVADMNLDGLPDIIIASSLSTTSAEVSFLYGQSGGGFNYVSNATTPQIDIASLNFPETNPQPTAIQAVDLNGDGYPDIYIGENVNQTYWGTYNPNTQQYSFAQEAFYDTPNSINLRTVSAAVADLDGSGAKDWLMMTTVNNLISCSGCSVDDNNLMVRLNGSLQYDLQAPAVITSPLGIHDFSFSYTPTAGNTYVAGTAGPLPITIGSYPGVTFSPASLDFGEVAVGYSLTLPLTITNNGNANLVISNFVFGSGGAVYSAINQCPPSLAPAASCTFQVTFTPNDYLFFNGQLLLTDNAPGTTQSVLTTGSGVVAAPGFNLTSNLLFGYQPVLTTSNPPMIATFSNTGNVPFTVGTMTLATGDIADFAVVPSATPCPVAPTTLPPGGVCLFAFTFTPQAVLHYQATASLPTSIGNTIVTLFGNGSTGSMQISVNEGILLTDTITPPVLPFAVNVAEGILLTDTIIPPVLPFPISVAEGILLTDTITPPVLPFTVNVAEGILLTDAITPPVLPFTVNVAEGILLTDTIIPPAPSSYATTTTLTAMPTSTTPGSVVLLATQTTAIGTSTIPNGGISFYDGSALLAIQAIGSTGASSLNVSTLGLGPHNIQARFPGDPASSGRPALTGSDSNIVTVTIANVINYLTVTATSIARPFETPNPALTYTVTGFVNGDTSAVLTGAPTLSTPAVQNSPAGNYPIILGLGTLAGPSNYVFELASGTLTIQGNDPETITFLPLPNVPLSVHSLNLTAHSTSGGLGNPIVYTVTGPASISGHILTLLGAGPVTVTATQAGNTTFQTAFPVSRTFTVTP